MNKKTFIILALVFMALAAGLWQSNKGRGGRSKGAEAMGAGWMGDVDWASLKAVAIVSGGNSVRIERIDGTWCVAEKGNYPADVARLRQMVQAIETQSGGQILDPVGSRPDVYGLSDEQDGSGPTAITLEHGKGTSTLRLGKTREPRRPGDMWGPPPGRYAQVDAGAIVLLKDDVPHADSDPELWWDRELLSVEAESLGEVRIGRGGESYAIRREGGDAFRVVDGKDDEEVDAGAAMRLFGALRHFRADRILPQEEIEGAAKEGGETRYEATASDEKYIVELGEPLANSPGSRPARILSPERRHFAGRWFQIPAYLANSMRMERNEVVRERVPVPPPLPEDGEATSGSDAPVEPDAVKGAIGAEVGKT